MSVQLHFGQHGLVRFFTGDDPENELLSIVEVKDGIVGVADVDEVDLASSLVLDVFDEDADPLTFEKISNSQADVSGSGSKARAHFATPVLGIWLSRVLNRAMKDDESLAN